MYTYIKFCIKIELPIKRKICRGNEARIATRPQVVNASGDRGTQARQEIEIEELSAKIRLVIANAALMHASYY